MNRCAHCGADFAGRKRQRYCSLRCSGKANENVVRRGQASHKYNGGLSFNVAEQRWSICCIDGTTIRFARAVMEAELRRPLRSDEIVHHINEDTADDRVENLRVVTRKEHHALHRKRILTARWGKGVNV